MSASTRRKRRARAAAAQRKQRARIILGSGAAGLAAVFALSALQEDTSRHPTPRPESHAGHVVPAARYEGNPRVAQTYQMAAAAPQIIDGLYCYCHCAEHSGHYSLLDCFKSDHAARCDVCMSEAAIGYQMAANGSSLDAIRKEIDRTYGT